MISFGIDINLPSDVLLFLLNYYYRNYSGEAAKSYSIIG